MRAAHTQRRQRAARAQTGRVCYLLVGGGVPEAAGGDAHGLPAALAQRDVAEHLVPAQPRGLHAVLDGRGQLISQLGREARGRARATVNACADRRRERRAQESEARRTAAVAARQCERRSAAGVGVCAAQRSAARALMRKTLNALACVRRRASTHRRRRGRVILRALQPVGELLQDNRAHSRAVELDVLRREARQFACFARAHAAVSPTRLAVTLRLGDVRVLPGGSLPAVRGRRGRRRRGSARRACRIQARAARARRRRRRERRHGRRAQASARQAQAQARAG